jgi:hypothetical protein
MAVLALVLWWARVWIVVLDRVGWLGGITGGHVGS